MKINKKISKNINNSERDFIDDDKSDENISSLKQVEVRGLDREDSQARNRSRIGLSDTYDDKINKKNKNGLMAIHETFTGININSNNKYINFSVYNNMRNAHAPVGLLVFHRSQKPRRHGHLGSIPSWSAFLNHSSNNIKHNLINI